jgi:hypothetical protein
MSPHIRQITDAEDPILAALERAPFVPLTEYEERLLAEADAHAGAGTPGMGFMARLETLRSIDAA